MALPGLEIVLETPIQEFTLEPAEGLNLPEAMTTVVAEVAHLLIIAHLEAVAIILTALLLHEEVRQVPPDLRLLEAQVVPVEVRGLQPEAPVEDLPEVAEVEVSNNWIKEQSTLQIETCKVFL